MTGKLQSELITKRREIQTEVRDHVEQLRGKVSGLGDDLAARKIKLQAIITFDADNPDILEDFTVTDAQTVLAVITQYETALAALPQI